MSSSPRWWPLPLLLALLAPLLISIQPDRAAAQAADPVLSEWVEPIAGVLDPDPDAVTRHLADDAAVWDIEVIGNTVYVGGTFTTVASAYDETRTSHSYLAAFDGSTGVWIDWWLPQFDGPVYALDQTSDGRLLVGGEFLTVNGDPGHPGLVALDAVTFQIDTTYPTRVERRWTTAPMVVRDLNVAGDRLYVAGNFNHVNGVRVYKAVRLDRDTGQLDTSWIPQLTNRSAFAIAESTDGERVHIGGWFDSVNGDPDGQMLATVSADTAQLVPGWEHDLNTFCCKLPKILDLDVYADNLFVGGSNDHWAMLDSRTGETIRAVPQAQVQDPQVVEVIGDRVYIGCHCSKRGPWIWVVDAATGEDLEDIAEHWTGDDGGWAVAQAPDGCLWTGGGFDSGQRADGTPVFAGNLLRTCPVGGPLPHGFTVIQQPPPPLVLECTVDLVDGRTVISWTDMGASGYDLSHDGEPARWVTATSAIDATPGTDYTVTAWGGEYSRATTDCTNPNPGGGGFSCAVNANLDGSATITWDDLGANGYDLSHDGEAPRWVRDTRWVDDAPGTTYTIVAWGNGVSGETTSCTA